MPNCSVAICKNLSGVNNKSDGVTYHIFPRDPKTKQQWMNATGNGPDWWPSKAHTICSVHFEERCFKQLKCSRRLYAWAIPTLKLRYMYAPSTMSAAKYETKLALAAEKCTQSKGVMMDDFEYLQNQAKLIVAKVYHFLEEEYKELTNKFGDLGELTATYINYCRRTSSATGVSERIIHRILVEEEEWKSSTKPKEEEPLNKRRRKRKRRTVRRISSDSDADLMDESGNNETQTDEATTEQQNEVELEPLVGEESSADEENSVVNSCSSQEGCSKTIIDVATENGYQTLKTQPIKIDFQEAQSIEIVTSNGYQTLQTQPVQLEFLEATPANIEIQSYEPVQTQTGQIEIQNLDTSTPSMVSKCTCTDLDAQSPPDLPDVGPMYCGMEAMGTMLGPTIVGSIQTQPLMTADHLVYCSMDPTMNPHACAVTMGPALQSPHAMMAADQRYCGPNISDQLNVGYATGMNYYVIL